MHLRRLGAALLVPALLFSSGIASGPASAAPAARDSALPKFPNHKIVIGKSIAGVRVAMDHDAAIAAWGGEETASYCTEYSCIWSDSKNGVDPGSEGSAQLNFDNEDGDVYAVVINAPAKGFDTPLAKIKTSKGIHLGNTVEQLKAAYGSKLKKFLNGVIYDYQITGDHRRTVFAMSRHGKIRSIYISPN